MSVLSGPETSTSDGEKRVALGVDDGQHHDVVKDGADDASKNLNNEVDSRRDLDVLTELQILQEFDALYSWLTTVERCVHVGDW